RAASGEPAGPGGGLWGGGGARQAGGAGLRANGGGGAKAGAPIAANPAEAAISPLRLGDLDIGLRQFVEEARGNVGLPQAVHAPVGGEIDFQALARAR